MKPEIELAVMSLVAEARELYLSQEEGVVCNIVKNLLTEALNRNSINIKQYYEALKVLERRTIK